MAKVVLVTGCNTKLGVEIVKKFLENNWIVVGTDKEPECIEKIENLEYIQGDLCEIEDRERILKATVKDFRKITAFINAVDTEQREKADILQTTEENFDFAIENNLKGIFFLTQLVAKRMITQRKNYEICGRIVNISSMYAYLTDVVRGEYCISKAGVSTMTKLFAHRLSPEGIIVNEIRPGIINSILSKEEEELYLEDKKKYDKLKENGAIPLDRWGTLGNIAHPAFLLCNDNLSYIVGQTIDIDGGLHLQRI